MEQFLIHWEGWLISVSIVACAVVLALLGHYLFFSLAERIARRTGSVFDSSVIRHVEKPSRAIAPLLAVYLVFPLLGFPPNVTQLLQHLTTLGLIASIAWLLVRLTGIFTDLISAKYGIGETDDLTARRMQTQIQLLRRIVGVVVGIVALALMLMTFPTIQHLGATLFASAGIAGLIAGLAARPTISNLIGGIQIALTEPIRLEDVVIVEGEWGRIEEIGTTYVVVRIWDLRRLVVPLSYFIERPFQNWTRQSTNLLATVFIDTDYTVPVNEVRQELHRILQASNLWDGKAWGLQVTNTTQNTMELRALMSAPDSAAAWDVRCYVREKLVEFLQQRYPQCLPKTRAEIRQM